MATDRQRRGWARLDHFNTKGHYPRPNCCKDPFLGHKADPVATKEAPAPKPPLSAAQQDTSVALFDMTDERPGNSHTR